MMDKLTNIKTLFFLVYNILFYHVEARTNVLHERSAITWLEANTNCKNGLEDNENTLKNSDIPIENEFWIGEAVYDEITPWIEVIGCTPTPDNDIEIYTVESVGHCQIACKKTKVFGYRMKALHYVQRNCACFIKGVPKVLNKTCDISSDYLVHTNYTSTIINDSNDPGNCVTLCCGYCKGLQSRIVVGRNCNATDSSIVGRCNTCDPNKELCAKWGLNYYNSRNNCWKNHKLLLPSSYCSESPSLIGTRAWTNVFRESVEVVKRGTHQNPILCFTGVLHQTINSPKYIAIFRKKCNADVKWYICKNTTVYDSGRTTNKLSSTLNPLRISTLKQSSSISKTVKYHTTVFSLHVTSLNQNLITSEISTSAVTDSGSNSITIPHNALTNNPLTDESLKKKIKSKSYTGIIIGGAAGAIVLLLISAVIYMCRKKSIGLFTGKEKTHGDKVELSQRPNYNSQCINRSYVEPISNQNYGIAINNSTTYAVVNKLTKSDKKSTNNDATYSDLPDGQYDQLNNIQKRKIILEGDLYDRHEGMRDQNDPTYDSSKFSSSHEETDAYDHSFLGAQNNEEYAYSSTYRSASTNETEIYDKTV